MLALQIAIGFGIAIIFPLLVYYGVSTFHPPPKRLQPGPKAAVVSEEIAAERRKYEADARSFARVLIIASTALGIAAILIGAFSTIHAIGTGLVLGGIAAVTHGYWAYCHYLEDWLRFVSLLAAFVMLLFVGVGLFSGQ